MSITLGALSVTDLTTNGLLFEIREGKPFTLAEYIGADDDIPLASGMDPDSLLTITTAGEFGAASATLENCRPQRMVTQSEFGSIQWIGHLELICIDSPPEWVVVEGS